MVGHALLPKKCVIRILDTLSGLQSVPARYALRSFWNVSAYSPASLFPPFTRYLAAYCCSPPSGGRFAGIAIAADCRRHPALHFLRFLLLVGYRDCGISPCVPLKSERTACLRRCSRLSANVLADVLPLVTGVLVRWWLS